jgi:hypothetical protein
MLLPHIKTGCSFPSSILRFYGVWTGEYVVEIDKQTASYRKITKTIPLVNYVYYNSSAYDSSKKTYYFLSSIESRLNGINVTTGALEKNPTLAVLETSL